MRIYFFLFLLSTGSIHADWKSEMVEKGTSLYRDAKETTVSLYRELKPAAITPEESREAHMRTLWDAILPQLEKGLHYTNALEKAPESAWIASDKKDIQDDIDRVFNTIIDTLIDDDFLSSKKEIHRYSQNINARKNSIAFYREKRISAPVESRLKTTKADYTTKIEALNEENRHDLASIEMIKSKLIIQFSKIGVKLSKAQIDVLLTRVDGDDIIQMALMMNLLKDITNQIMTLMQENNESLEYAKKYYGLHLVTLELVVYIQQNYIDKVTHRYLPKIETLIFESEKMVAETEKLAASEMSERRRQIYEKNILTQKLTAHAATRYKEDLITSRKSMATAQKITKKNLLLARNTYKTVLLSTDLYTLIAESQTMFSQVSKIQVPDIVPFENIQIEKKYYELTRLIEKR